MFDKNRLKDGADSDKMMSMNRIIVCSLIMLLLLIGIGFYLEHYYSKWAYSMHLEYNDYYQDMMYSEPNYPDMVALSEFTMIIVLIVGYFLFRKDRYWLFHCVFWFLSLCIVDYIISGHFPICHFQSATSAISRSFDREVSPFVVVFSGAGAALTLSLSLFAALHVKCKSLISKALIVGILMYFGIGASILVSIINYMIGLFSGL